MTDVRQLVCGVVGATLTLTLVGCGDSSSNPELLGAKDLPGLKHAATDRDTSSLPMFVQACSPLYLLEEREAVGAKPAYLRNFALAGGVTVVAQYFGPTTFGSTWGFSDPVREIEDIHAAAQKCSNVKIVASGPKTLGYKVTGAQVSGERHLGVARGDLIVAVSAQVSGSKEIELDMPHLLRKAVANAPRVAKARETSVKSP